MGVFGKGKGADKSASPSIEEDVTKVGPLKNEKDELDMRGIKVPAFPGTEERVTVVAIDDTKWHKKGDEFSIPKANLSKLEEQGYKLKK